MVCALDVCQPVCPPQHANVWKAQSFLQRANYARVGWVCGACLSGYPEELEEVWHRVFFFLYASHILVPGALGLPNCCRMNQQMKQLIVLSPCKRLSPTALSCVEPSPDAYGLGLSVPVLPTLPSHASIGCNACYLA